MKRIWGYVFGGAVFASGAGAALSACAHDDSTIFVHGVLAPQIVAVGTSCLFTADPTQEVLSAGTLDISVRPDLTYEASFLLANQLVARGDPTAPQTETSYVTIKGAIVRITDSNGVQLKTFTRLGTTLLNPAQGVTPGFAPFTGLEILDADTVKGLGALNFNDVRRLVTYTKFYGNTLGGQYVESNEYEFPVDVCNGCLVSFSQSDISNACLNLNCNGNGTSTMAPQVPCDLEDFAVDCAACRSYSAMCAPTCIPVPTTPTMPSDAGGG